MADGDRDPALDALLDLDGQILVVDPPGGHWVRFVVRRVPESPERPHGLDYSLTLHGPDGERLVGFEAPTRHARRPGPAAGRGWRATISTGCGRSAPTTTATRPPCWLTSGPRWTRCSGREE